MLYIGSKNVPPFEFHRIIIAWFSIIFVVLTKILLTLRALLSFPLKHIIKVKLDIDCFFIAISDACRMYCRQLVNCWPTNCFFFPHKRFHKFYSRYLKIQLEDLKDYQRALSYIGKLEFYEVQLSCKK